MRSAGAIARPAFCLYLVVAAAMSEPALAQSTGIVRGRVLDERGAAVPGARVQLRPIDPGRDGAGVGTDSDGIFELPALQPGLYAVTAGTAELASDMFRIRVRAGRRVEVNVTLARGRRDASWLTELGHREAASRAFAAGLAASRAGDIATAVEQFRRAIDRRPACAACFYNLAVAYVDLEQLDEAEAAFSRVVALSPDYAAAYYGLASVYTKLGRTADAGAARSEATRLALADLAARREQLQTALDQAIATLRAGQPAVARVHFEKLLAQDSGFSAPYFWLGMALRDLNELTPAAEAFEFYLALDGDGELADDAREALASLGRPR